MALRRYRDGDFDLTEALETDPEVMRELGGPIDRSRLPGLHRSRLEEPWWFTIALGPGGPAVGTIGIWPGILDGAAIHETGWLLLPAFHGRGIAGAALDELIARAGTVSAFASLHAFPAVTNAPSNALCRRSGLDLARAAGGRFPRTRPRVQPLEAATDGEHSARLNRLGGTGCIGT